MGDISSQGWEFYGRDKQVAELREVLRRRRWFFLKVTGRRRIGKSTLVRRAIEAEGSRRFVYIQIPDTDSAGVTSEARAHLLAFGIDAPPIGSLSQLATELGRLMRAGYIVVLDEFQYFHRRSIYEFTSFLQREVDQILFKQDAADGALIVLGSIHTEMTALLENRNAPLYGRLSHRLDVPHLEIATLLEILRDHSEPTPQRLLFLWTLFEGVPKFYRDAFALGVLGADRKTLLRRLFFEGLAALTEEAEAWFLKEVHGRFDVILKYIAEHPGCTHAEIAEFARAHDATSPQHVSVYLRTLTERYQIVEHLQPVFAKPRAKRGRFYLRDNFLRSWLAALSVPTSVARMGDVSDAVDMADQRLATLEGSMLERLARTLYVERSRAHVGDFPLTQAVEGYWDRAGTEVDFVAIHEFDKRIRLGTCKRDADRLAGDLANFEAHAARFLQLSPQLKGWRVEKVAITVEHTRETRRAVELRGIIAQDLNDLTRGL